MPDCIMAHAESPYLPYSPHRRPPPAVGSPEPSWTSDIIGLCVRRSRTCQIFCGACNWVGFGFADINRIPILWFAAMLHAAVVALSLVGFFGIFKFSLGSVPWAMYEANASASGFLMKPIPPTSMVDIHINIWGGCLYWDEQHLCLGTQHLTRHVCSHCRDLKPAYLCHIVCRLGLSARQCH